MGCVIPCFPKGGQLLARPELMEIFCFRSDQYNPPNETSWPHMFHVGATDEQPVLGSALNRLLGRNLRHRAELARHAANAKSNCVQNSIGQERSQRGQHS